MIKSSNLQRRYVHTPNTHVRNARRDTPRFLPAIQSRVVLCAVLLSQSLAIDEKNAKALFRRGTAHDALGTLSLSLSFSAAGTASHRLWVRGAGNFDAAAADLQAALALSPNDPAIVKALSACKAKDAEKQKAADAKLRAGLSKMFG
jgi:hypothetical protein